MIEDWKHGRRIGIYSPWQRRSGGIRLTVDIHVEDLRELIETKVPDKQPAIIGESWGAMLALAFAGKYPKMCKCIALVGCGTFTDETRKELTKRRLKRIRSHISKHPEFESDLELPVFEQVLKWHEMTDIFSKSDDSGAAISEGDFDRQAFDETWRDMIRCQQKGIYPADFVNFLRPVTMIHGEYDPHPGRLTATHLQSYLPHLEYKEISKCGHSPHIEKYAKEEFFEFLISWLTQNCEA